MFFIPVYILILFLTIIIDYFAGILIENAQGIRRKKFLLLSLIANIGVLAIFKYYNFLNDNLSGILGWVQLSNPVPYLDIILPIGLSFHTFQAMSYTIEVYRRNQAAERHFGIYALYVMFYPQLVAGPIERPQNLLHQFREKHFFEYTRVTNGLKLMAWGLFKKAVVADRLAILVDTVYDNPQAHEGLTVILATIFFAFQIYCDFSGYSDIAIGAAQVMGFKLMTNFNRPYFAKSISEFWKRWHISLSTWFKDYLYIPLGGNRVGRNRMFFNLFLTFMISGLWHGANWTFIIWGALHGFYLIAALILQPLTDKLNKVTGIKNYPVIYKWSQSLAVFALVCFAWVFFRASSIHDAFTIIINASNIHMSQISFDMLGNNPFELAAGMFFICLLIIIEWNMRGKQMRAYMNNKPWYYRWTLYIILVLIILNFGVFGGNSFIYFQF
jgi:alginate O-acetyltransferase complex protein AlgI